MLAERRYVGGRPEDFSASLSGPYDRGHGEPAPVPELIRFSGSATNLCRTNETLWLIAQMARWDVHAFPEDLLEVIQRVYDVATLREAAGELSLEVAAQDTGVIALSGSVPLDPMNVDSYVRTLARERRRPEHRAVGEQSGKHSTVAA